MVVRKDLLEILVCPELRTPLSIADDAQIDQINGEIREGRVVNRSGELLTQTIDGGLIRSDGAFLYPVIDGFPVMLRDDSIPLGTAVVNPLGDA